MESKIITARIIKIVRASDSSGVTFKVELRPTAGVVARWPQHYTSYEAALVAANSAGLDVLLGWSEEHDLMPVDNLI